MGRPAVAIVSGGMDSITLVYWMINRGYDPHLISFNYGQRHRKELDFAKWHAHELDLKHDIVDLTGLTSLISNSALTGEIEVPEGHYADDNMKLTVVPNRNMIMASIAAGIAVNEKAEAIGIGVHAGDHAVYPDCRPIFVQALEETIHVACDGFIHDDFAVLAPFVESGKHDIVKIGHPLGVPYEKTWSCYGGGAVHCGRCGTCVERAEAFVLAGVQDPTEYESPDFWRRHASS